MVVACDQFFKGPFPDYLCGMTGPYSLIGFHGWSVRNRDALIIFDVGGRGARGRDPSVAAETGTLESDSR